MRKINKKGMEITLNFVVIAAIVLIALIVAILFFTGASTTLFKKQTEITSTQLQAEIGLAEQKCATACAMGIQSNFDNPQFSETVRNANYNKCTDFPAFSLGFEELCKKKCKSLTPGSQCSGLNRDLCSGTLGCQWAL